MKDFESGGPRVATMLTSAALVARLGTGRLDQALDLGG
jgi:hypothetical protein